MEVAVATKGTHIIVEAVCPQKRLKGGRARGDEREGIVFL